MAGRESCRGQKLRVKELPTSLPPPPPQSSHFIALPMEIKQKIYDHIFTEWTFAIFDSPGVHMDHRVQHHYQRLDTTITLRRSGSKLVSGPPGSNLMLTSRAIHNSVRYRYGKRFTGRLIIGLRLHPHNTLGLYLQQHCRLRKWYRRVRSLFVCFSSDIKPLKFEVEKLFPNLRYTDAIIYDNNSTLLDRPLNRIAHAILQGEYDWKLCDKVNNATRAFFGKFPQGDLGYPRPFYTPPVLFTPAVFDVKLVHPGASGHILGFQCRWEGSHFKIASRVIRESGTIEYCENDDDNTGHGLGPFSQIHTESLGRGEATERFQWVQQMDLHNGLHQLSL